MNVSHSFLERTSYNIIQVIQVKTDVLKWSFKFTGSLLTFICSCGECIHLSSPIVKSAMVDSN